MPNRAVPLPLVTVVIPVYKKADTIGRAIQSVKAQSLSNFECVVVIDGSPDNSEEVARLNIGGDPRFSILVQENKGVAHARNAGIRHGLAPFVCCLDGDDEIAPPFLETCVFPLLKDPSLGIAYTRLMAIRPDGTGVLSQWPGKFDFERSLQGGNQVPTCCVFRRNIWSRLGGYRQRYAPLGAGAEDAEFWLRISAAGYRGELASDEALFLYHLGGQVSGDPNYREVDWRAWHPWVRDGLHPFASVARPHNGISHPVRSYADPKVAVVIPCASYHQDVLIDALDSLEAQEFRDWEAIVVADNWSVGRFWIESFPYVTWLEFQDQEQPAGAGVSRNYGAKTARAPYLLFLDADDWLAPRALKTLYMEALRHPGHIIYSDYVGHAYVDSRERERLRAANRLVAYDERTDKSIIRYFSSDYNCEEAIRQPKVRADGSFYIWNLVSSLVPRRFHEEIGGFDEQMPSWEDWDYWLRLARRGKCYTRIQDALVEYRFYTGQRRALANPQESGDTGRQLSKKLIEYLQEKYSQEEPAMCGGCGKSKTTQTIMPPQAALQPFMSGIGGDRVDANDLVWVELNDGNIGEHQVAVQGQSYGYRKHGDRFKMLRSHAQVLAGGRAQVKILSEQDMNPVPAVTEISPPVRTLSPPLPVKPHRQEIKREVVEPDDLTEIWGIGEERAKLLNEAGVRTFTGFYALGESRIMEMFEISKLMAARMKNSVEKLLDI